MGRKRCGNLLEVKPHDLAAYYSPVRNRDIHKRLLISGYPNRMRFRYCVIYVYLSHSLAVPKSTLLHPLSPAISCSTASMDYIQPPNSQNNPLWGTLEVGHVGNKSARWLEPDIFDWLPRQPRLARTDSSEYSQPPTTRLKI